MFRRVKRSLLCAVVAASVVGCATVPPSRTALPSAPSSLVAQPSVAVTPSSSAATTSPVAPTSAPTWTEVPRDSAMAFAQLEDIVWTGTQFVASGQNALLDSADGISWRLHRIANSDASPVALASGPRGVIAVAGTTPVWLSTDGSSWKTIRTAIVNERASPVGFEETVRAVVSTDSGWLAVGRQDPVCQIDCFLDPTVARVWTSTDATTWKPIHAANFDGAGMNAVTRLGSGFVAGGLAAGRAVIWTSSDGVTWDRVADDPMFHPSAAATESPWIHVTGVAANNGVVVAIGMEGPTGDDGGASVRAWWSDDGRTWSAATGDRFAGGQAFAVASTPSGFIATGPSGPDSCEGGIWESANGRAWTCSSGPRFAHFSAYAAAASPSALVAVGFDDVPDSNPGAVWIKSLR